jgi:hypothetical protein
MNVKSGGNTLGKLRRSAARIASAIAPRAAIFRLTTESWTSLMDSPSFAKGGTQVAQ